MRRLAAARADLDTKNGEVRRWFWIGVLNFGVPLIEGADIKFGTSTSCALVGQGAWSFAHVLGADSQAESKPASEVTEPGNTAQSSLSVRKCSR